LPNEKSDPAAVSARNSGRSLWTSPEREIDVGKRLVRVRFGRKVSETAIAAYAMWLRANPDFDPSFSEIVDLRQVEQFDLQGDDMLKLADQVDPFSPNSKRAFVAGNTEQKYAAKMHKLLRASKENFRICQTMDEAERWVLTGSTK